MICLKFSADRLSESEHSRYGFVSAAQYEQSMSRPDLSLTVCRVALDVGIEDLDRSSDRTINPSVYRRLLGRGVSDS